MRAGVFVAPDSDQKTRRLARFQDDADLARFDVAHIGHDEVIAAFLIRGIDDGRAPFFRSVFQPALKLISNLRQGLSSHTHAVAVVVEEAHHAGGFLEGLNETVQQEPIEAPVSELDAILVVLVESVHGDLPVVEQQELNAVNASTGVRSWLELAGYQGRTPLASYFPAQNSVDRYRRSRTE
jgi:hypothetical protein